MWRWQFILVNLRNIHSAQKNKVFGQRPWKSGQKHHWFEHPVVGLVRDKLSKVFIQCCSAYHSTMVNHLKGTSVAKNEGVFFPSRRDPGSSKLRMVSAGTYKYYAFSFQWLDQWSFLVPLIGGRYHIIPQLAVYATYIPLIYCLLGDYISPTTYEGNQKQPLSDWIP